jgi:hypothetical protein
MANIAKLPLLILFISFFAISAIAQDTARFYSFKIKKDTVKPEVKKNFDTTMTFAQWMNLSRNWHDYLISSAPYFGYISCAGGIAIPVSNFASTIYFGEGGYAKQGWGADISFGIPIKHKRFGIAGRLGYTNNAFNNSAYNKNMAPYQGEVMQMNNTSYQSFSGTLGLFISLNNYAFHNTFFKLSLTAGVLSLTLPKVSIENSSGNIPTSPPALAFENSQSPSVLFVYDAGLFIEHYLTDRTYIVLKGDFLSNALAKSNPAGNVSGTKIPVATVNIGIGLAYNLN